MPNRKIKHIIAKIVGANDEETLDVYDVDAIHTDRIVTNLTTNSDDYVLSASQGKVLNDRFGDSVVGIRSYLASGSDLNNATTIGIYTLAGSYSYTNLPENVTYGTLCVFRPTISGTYVFQIICPCSSGNIYCRGSVNNGGTWSDWRRFVGSDELASQVIYDETTTSLTLPANDTTGTAYTLTVPSDTRYNWRLTAVSTGSRYTHCFSYSAGGSTVIGNLSSVSVTASIKAYWIGVKK